MGKTSFETAREIVASATNVDLREINDDAGIGKLAEWDSMAHINIILAVEAHLDVRLSTEQIISIISVSTIARLLAGSLETNNAS